jgi:hypothetical protein
MIPSAPIGEARALVLAHIPEAIDSVKRLDFGGGMTGFCAELPCVRDFPSIASAAGV